jgi:ubiquinone/menaquinone biosynthesis C-methylase UbiE
MSIKVYTAEQLRPRIIRAIKNGNNELKYIEEATKAEYSTFQFMEAIRQLEKEGVIKYNDLLEGYYLQE